MICHFTVESVRGNAGERPRRNTTVKNTYSKVVMLIAFSKSTTAKKFTTLLFTYCKLGKGSQMKTLPKRVHDVLTKALGSYDLYRVIYEEFDIGVSRCYVCGSWYGVYFAAWNDVKDFQQSDIIVYDCLNDAWNYLNSSI